MLIRLATSADADAISALVTSMTERYIAHEFSAEGQRKLLATLTPEKIRANQEAGYRYHVAEAGGAIIGVVGTVDNQHLYHLFVADTHHRQGVARALWAEAMAACRAAGNPGIYTVNASRYAQPVYERLGFVPRGAPQNTGGVICVPMKLVIAEPNA
jgi:GNAT superfamily N-acetyltransferase